MRQKINNTTKSDDFSYLDDFTYVFILLQIISILLFKLIGENIYYDNAHYSIIKPDKH